LEYSRRGYTYQLNLDFAKVNMHATVSIRATKGIEAMNSFKTERGGGPELAPSTLNRASLGKEKGIANNTQ
jgi:hypothetical protein